MANTELFFLSILRALVEVALLSLLGQGLVGLLSGARRLNNPVYQLFAVITRPVVRMTRFLTPRVILDRHVPFVAFFLLFWLWLFLAWAKRWLAA
jgi:uncharacterized protein YggT (Ycf19 family)